MSIALDILRPKSSNASSPKGAGVVQNKFIDGLPQTRSRPYTSPAGLMPVSRHILSEKEETKKVRKQRSYKRINDLKKPLTPQVPVSRPSSLVRSTTPSEELLPLPTFSKMQHVHGPSDRCNFRSPLQSCSLGSRHWIQVDTVTKPV